MSSITVETMKEALEEVERLAEENQNLKKRIAQLEFALNRRPAWNA